MLSKDMATVLGNRYLDESVYPYSFKEFLGAKGIDLDKNWEYGKKRNDVTLIFNEFFSWGGFPELMLYKNKRKWLSQLYEKILLGDIIQRHKLKNELAIRLTYKRLAETVKHPVAYNRIANLVKSTGVNTNPTSVIDYVEFAKEAFLVFSLENYASKFTACYSTSKDITTFERELNALISLDKVHPLDRMIIVTYDEERIHKADNGKEIEIIPLWKWLLR